MTLSLTLCVSTTVTLVCNACGVPHLISNYIECVCVCVMLLSNINHFIAGFVSLSCGLYFYGASGAALIRLALSTLRSL